MMSQNRQAAREKHESIIDFAINYKSEQEIDDMQSHLHRIEGELLEVKKLILALSNSPNKMMKSEEESHQKTVI
jgi:uncharacterized membrane protein